MKIAVAGKGGVGKTTFTAALVKELVKMNEKPLLVVDADPNSNINEHLGMEVDATISDIREDVRDEKKIPQGMSKSDFVNLKLSQSITEGSGIDLLAMGRPEGKGCYCFVNELLRTFLSNLGKNYRHVIIDNEAGMEHLSRRTTDNLDFLFIVTNTDPVSLNAGKRILKTARELKLAIGQMLFVVNRTTSRTDKASIEAELGKESSRVAVFIPEIEELGFAIPAPENTQLNEAVKKVIGIINI